MHLDPFYLIVDSADWLPRLLPQGVRLVQLRIKDRSADETKTPNRSTSEMRKRLNAEVAAGGGRRRRGSGLGVRHRSEFQNFLRRVVAGAGAGVPEDSGVLRQSRLAQVLAPAIRRGSLPKSIARRFGR